MTGTASTFQTEDYLDSYEISLGSEASALPKEQPRPPDMCPDSRSEDTLEPCFYEAIIRMASYRKLGPNWDSYGAERISEKAIQISGDLLTRIQSEWSIRLGESMKPYFVAPVANGGIQLEWRGDYSEIEVEIGPGGDLGYLLVKGNEPGKEDENCSIDRILCEIGKVLGAG